MNKDIEAFHRSRRMFCIKDDVVYVAEQGTTDSHGAWFAREGWAADIIETAVRGYVDTQGSIYFYQGNDFVALEETEQIFFRHLRSLVEKLGLSLDAKIYGGKIRQDGTTDWPARKSYGTVSQNLEK